MNPKDFRSAYLETVYTAGGISWVFSPEDCGLQVYGRRRFALITAANPRSEAWSDADNDRRNSELEESLYAYGWEYDQSLGSSPTGEWHEKGFTIWDGDVNVGLFFAREFEQNAIVYGEAGRVALVWCDDGDLEWFYAEPH